MKTMINTAFKRYYLVHMTFLSGSESPVSQYNTLLNFILSTLCAHALRSKVWREMEDLFQALCVNPIVVPSLKCGCPDYPAVRHRSKWVSGSGGGQGWGGQGWRGGDMNEMLSDPAAITNHQSNLIS